MKSASERVEITGDVRSDVSSPSGEEKGARQYTDEKQGSLTEFKKEKKTPGLKWTWRGAAGFERKGTGWEGRRESASAQGKISCEGEGEGAQWPAAVTRKKKEERRQGARRHKNERSKWKRR